MFEDTSFAIHPEFHHGTEKKEFRKLGAVIDWVIQDNTHYFECENGWVAIQFYSTDIVRITMNPSQKPVLNDSRSVVASPVHIATSQQLNDTYLIKTNRLQLHINKTSFNVTILDQHGNKIMADSKDGMAFNSDGEVIGYKELQADEHFYGFGEKTGYLDKRGEKYEMWNTDVYAPHNPETDPLYESIPFFMSVCRGQAYGLFLDNTSRTTFDMKSFDDQYSFRAEGGQLDYYVFIGPTPKDVLRQYTYVTGRMHLPPKWALGYHQSRYSYQSEQEVRILADTFIEHELPIDAIHLDIHYMNGYRVFSFDSNRFPNPNKLIRDLRKKGIRIIPIVDAGVKKDAEYQIYQEGIRNGYFCQYVDGDVYYGDVWPGVSAFPDFTNQEVRKWWGDKHHFYTDMGIEGIWNDMNEPAVFNETKTMDVTVVHQNDGKPSTHRKLHNIYGFLMEEATYEGMKAQLGGKRPFVLTRAGYAGVQRYAAVWTGDNRSFWEHLQMSLPMIMNLGLSGVALAGADVGGFAYDTNAELLTRWMQVGVFMPFFRNHSAIGFRYQEPWQFGVTYEAIMKRFMQMRYEWMPQLYSLFYEASQTGIPVVRPLMLEFPDDERTYNLNDQFMVGDNVIVAPVMEPSITDRVVYLPAGEWVEFTTNRYYAGERAYLIHADLDHLPIFVKCGTLVMQTEWKSNVDKEPKVMKAYLYTGKREGQNHATFYDDDGETFQYQEGQYLKLELDILQTSANIGVNVTSQEGGFRPQYSEIEVHVIGHLQEQNGIINENSYREKIIIPIK